MVTEADGALVVWSDDYLDYNQLTSHPMNPLRLTLTMQLAGELGVLPEGSIVPPEDLADAALHVAHSPRYIAAVASAYGEADPLTRAVNERVYGLGTDDNPLFPRMHEIAKVMVGGTLTAARAIAEGRTRRAVNISGGMHHAMKGHAAGFCIYNDCVVAIDHLLARGFDRIAYIDVDAHHGDGVQRAFAHDPRVMTVSIHQHPRTLWPNTGYPSEVGDEAAAGTSVNIPLPPRAGDEHWLRAFHAVVPGVIGAFKPQIIISQCGADSHFQDPMADLAVSVDGQRAAMIAMRELADRYSDGRWLAVGGGGYGLVRIVPRSWTHLLAVASGVDLAPDTPTPPGWRETAQGLLHEEDPVPLTMSDGGDARFVPWDGGGSEDADALLVATDAGIVSARRALYPLHGLDPEDPRD